MVAAVVISLLLLVVEAEHGFLGEAGEAQSRTFPALLLPHQVARQGKVYQGWDLFSLKSQTYVKKEQNVLTALSVPISTEAAATQVPAAPAGIPAAAKQPPATTIPAATTTTTIPAAAWQLAAAEISVSAEEAKDKAAFSAT